MSGSQKKMGLSWGIYISCVDNQRKSFKVAKSIYHVWITKEKVLKLRSLYISYLDHQRKCFKFAESIYHVWITKENVLKLQSLYIMCGSPKKKF